jgi:hypothetical protein
MAVPRRRSLLALAALAGAAVALVACTGGGVSSGSSAAGGGAAAGAPAAPAAADVGAAGAAAGSGQPAGGYDAAGVRTGAAPVPGAKAAAPGTGRVAGAADPSTVRPRVIRTAQVVVQVDGQLAAAAARVRAVAESLAGSVSSETTTYADGAGTTPAPAATGTANGDGRPAPSRAAAPAPSKVRAGESVIVLRVPEADLDRALALVTGPGGVGKELDRTTSAQDVTGDLADLASRVATQQASVARVRALLASATSLKDIVLLESEVSTRESDLEALQARRAVLADQADLATLTVDLRTPATIPPPPAEPADPNAFLQGLQSGWHAVVASTTVIVTVLGALLPLAVVAALLGVPVLWVLRRRRSAAGPQAPARAPAPAPADAV